MSGILDARGNPIRLDGLQNVFTGLAGSFDHRRGNRILASPRLVQTQIDALYESDPIAAKIVDCAPQDATRRGFDLGGECSAPDWSKHALEALDGLGAMPALAKWLEKNRKDGGALLLMEVNDGASLEQALIPEAVQKIRALEVIERWGVNIERDPNRESPTYGRPLYYAVHQSNRKPMKIHVSRVLALHGIRVSEMRDSIDGGWGMSELQRPREALEAYAECWGYVQTTFKHFSTLIYKMAGLGTLMAGGQDELVRRRMALLGQFISTIGVTPVDGDDDIVERAVSFSGVADMLRQAQDRVASAANMPLTKLFGHAPAGLSTDDESGRGNWDDTVQQVQTRTLVPALNRILDILFASKMGPTGRVAPTRYQLTPRPLRQPTEKERSENRARDAQATGLLLQTGVLTEAQAARGIVAFDPTNPYGITADDIRALEQMRAEPSPADVAEAAIVAPAPGAEPAPGGMAEPVAASETALNGSQVASALNILGLVSRREMPRDSGIAALVEFYNVDPAQAERVMGSIGKSFFTPTEAAPGA